MDLRIEIEAIKSESRRMYSRPRLMSLGNVRALTETGSMAGMENGNMCTTEVDASPMC